MTLERALVYDDVKWWQMNYNFNKNAIHVLQDMWMEEQIAHAGGIPVFLRERSLDKGYVSKSLRPLGGGQGGSIELLIQQIKDGVPAEQRISQTKFRRPEEIESLDGFEYFIRSEMMTSDDIAHLGGVPLVSSQDRRQIERWPEIVDPSFTHRKVGIVAVNELFPEDGSVNTELLIPYSREFSTKYAPLRIKRDQPTNRVFIKPMVKIDNGLACDVEVGDGSPVRKKFQYYLDRDEYQIDYFIVSEPVDFVAEWAGGMKGNYFTIEYRCWVADGRVTSIARNDLHEVHEIPEEVSKTAQKFAEAHKSILPWGYVVDFGILDEDQTVAVIELNELGGSGRYKGNDFFPFLEAFASNFDKAKAERALPEIEEKLEELKNMQYASTPLRIWW